MEGRGYGLVEWGKILSGRASLKFSQSCVSAELADFLKVHVVDWVRDVVNRYRFQSGYDLLANKCKQHLDLFLSVLLRRSMAT